MGVSGALVGGARDDGRLGLIGDVVDGEGVLVVREAELLAVVLSVGASVDGALGIVGVAILSGASGVDGVLGVRDIDHVETTGAELAADGDDGVGGLGAHDVVGAAEASEVGDVGLDGEGLGLAADAEELLEVEDLETVALGLGTDVGVVLDDLDVAPKGVVGLDGETTNVLDAAVAEDLDEGGTVNLTDDTELAAIARSPTPDVVTLELDGKSVLSSGIVGEIFNLRRQSPYPRVKGNRGG